MSEVVDQGGLRSPFPKALRASVLKHKKIVLVIMIVLILIPFLLILLEGIQVYSMDKQMQAGMNHLQAAAHVFQGNAGDGIVHYLDEGKLQQAQGEIDAAHADFASLNTTLEQDSALSLASPFWPAQISTVRALAQIATDGTTVAQDLLKTVQHIAPSLVLALQNNSSGTTPEVLQPYLTPASYQEIAGTLDTIAPLVHQMALDARGVSLNSLPISSKQNAMLASILVVLPVFDAVLQQRSAFQQPLAWFLGIDSQRSFLIEPMDSSELRATGGFTGQFGELVLNGGHIGPLKLSNIGKYEEDHTDVGSPPDPTIFPKVVGQSAPAPYADWWPIPNFGVRDANLSADFPTSARIVMERYLYEFGRSVDGVIMFTPVLIQHVLHVTGPIAIPAYNQTVTEQNLEDLLHYYQLDNAGIYQEQQTEHVKDPELARKLFTQRVTSALISAVTHLPLNKMLFLANEILQSMKSKDLEVYVTNSQAEALIGKYGSTASLDRSTTHDGLFIVQSNLSASKASQYVTTIIKDAVQLDNQGGATHHLQVILDYKQLGNVYGLDTYRDYLRVYVPENSQFLAGNGFDQYDRPYCGDWQSGYRLCQPDVYGDGSLVCTSLPIEIGYAASYFGDPYEGTDHPLDRIGPPQNQQSDEAGRAMFGGWVVVPKDCTMTVTLSWYVPPMGTAYSLLLQGQSSVDALLDLTIQPPTGPCAAPQGSALHDAQIMNGEDLLFTMQPQRSACALE